MIQQTQIANIRNKNKRRKMILRRQKQILQMLLNNDYA